MTTLLKNSQFSFRTNDILLKKAKEIASSENFDMATIMNALLTKIVELEEVPIDLIDEKKKRREKIIDELYREIEMGREDFRNGKYKTLDEVAKKYGI